MIACIGFTTRLAALLLVLSASLYASETAPLHTTRLLVEGTVFDADTREPIPHATVRAEGTGRSTLTNGEGRYHLRVAADSLHLKFSHVAYFSEHRDITSADTTIVADIYLHPCVIKVGSMRVYRNPYDPGQQIIVEAIRRKEDILSKIHDYRYDAYVKLLVNDETKADSSEIWLITETQMTAYWEQPDKYKEIITSRRQSSNMEAENNLVTVGEILNFNRDRIELGRYSVVSPTATDALDHYDYYLMDTLYIDSQVVFQLEIEPKNPDKPLFEGFICIADSTYDVVEVDVGFSRGVELPMLKELRYSQRFAQFEDEFWMPIQITFSCKVEFSIPLPGIPKNLGLFHSASLYSYEFEAGHASGLFDEYVLEVDEKADEFDSTAWYARQTIPLTEEEVLSYQRIDSLENLPASVGEIAATVLGGAVFMTLFGNPELFRFNRVEGPYLGLRKSFELMSDRLWVNLGVGYAFDAEFWQHSYGVRFRLHERRQLYAHLSYCNRVTRRSTFTSGGFRSTLMALWDQSGPHDFYRTEGIRASLSTKLVKHTRFGLNYNDETHFSMPAVSDFSFFGDDEDSLRVNPTVAEGKLRTVNAWLSYDSRDMIKNKGRDELIGATRYTKIDLGIEYASPDFISNDFNFRRYHATLYRRQQTLGMGMTSLRLFAGSSDGTLPPQRYFAASYTSGIRFKSCEYSTLNDVRVGGSRALSIRAKHDFRRQLFVASGIPLVRDIPLWLSIHGGILWTDFANHKFIPGDESIVTIEKPYRELGFGLGNLTPFLAPFNFSVHFIWQLSDYDTSDFRVSLGLF